jgi:aryl-alcohol dehydrogenase-like predicted oxidoreductase
MKYTTLGHSGLIVSRLSFGAMTFGTGEFHGFKFTVDQPGANAMISRALEAGVNFFDTADMYANGQSEEILGRALGQRRKDVVIATKVAARMSNALINAGISYHHIMAAAEASLKRLGTDYIDLYYLHFDDRITPLEEMLRALENLVHRGLVRYVGFSNFPVWRAAVAQGIQRERDYAPFIAAQMNYSLLARDIEQEFVPFAEHAGIGITVWSPLAGGFLSGKYTPEDPTGGGGRLANFSFLPVNRELGYKVVDKLREIATAHNASVAQVSLAWLLAKPCLSSVIIGASKMQHLEDNLGATNVNLSSEEIKALDDMTATPLLYPHWMYARPADPVVHEALHGR